MFFFNDDAWPHVNLGLCWSIFKFLTFSHRNAPTQTPSSMPSRAECKTADNL